MPDEQHPAARSESSAEGRPDGKRDRSARGKERQGKERTSKASRPTDSRPLDSQPTDSRPTAQRLKTLARPLGGVLAGVVLVAAGGGLVAATALAPRTPGSSPRPAPQAAVPAGNLVAVCPAPARLLQATPVGTDPQFSPESATAKSAVSALVLGNASGVLPGSRLAGLTGGPLVELAKAPAVPATASPAPAPATTPPAPRAAVAQRGIDAVSVLSADAFGDQQPSAAAAMSYAADDGDLRGTAAAACQNPANDLWLVGADTSLGRTAVLNLSNASGTPATVNLDLFGAKGVIQAPGSRGLLVAPGTTRSIVLAGLAPGQDSLAVRVRSTGGPVAAVIQQSVLRGLTPGGVDFITPGTGPATRQAVTGLDIQDPAALGPLTAKSGFEDAGPALQIAVPGAADAVVEVKMYGRDGQKPLPGGGVVTAKAGSVTTVPLAGVPAGHYTVSASSDVSFTAAARVTRGLKAEDPTDAAWAPSAIRLGSQHLVPVPAAGSRFLMFGAPDGRATISYTPVTADGKIRSATTADIAGGTTASVQIPANVEGSAVVGYLVSAAGEAAYGAVLLERDGKADVATVPVSPGAAGQEKVAVTLGY